MKKPQELHLVITQEFTDGEWEMDALMNKVEKEIEARENAMAKSNQSSRRHGSDQPTATLLTTTGSGYHVAIVNNRIHLTVVRW